MRRAKPQLSIGEGLRLNRAAVENVVNGRPALGTTEDPLPLDSNPNAGSISSYLVNMPSSATPGPLTSIMGQFPGLPSDLETPQPAASPRNSNAQLPSSTSKLSNQPAGNAYNPPDSRYNQYLTSQEQHDNHPPQHLNSQFQHAIPPPSQPTQYSDPRISDLPTTNLDSGPIPPANDMSGYKPFFSGYTPQFPSNVGVPLNPYLQQQQMPFYGANKSLSEMKLVTPQSQLTFFPTQAKLDTPQYNLGFRDYPKLETPANMLGFEYPQPPNNDQAPPYAPQPHPQTDNHHPDPSSAANLDYIDDISVQKRNYIPIQPAAEDPLPNAYDENRNKRWESRLRRRDEARKFRLGKLHDELSGIQTINTDIPPEPVIEDEHGYYPPNYDTENQPIEGYETNDQQLDDFGNMGDHQFSYEPHPLLQEPEDDFTYPPDDNVQLFLDSQGLIKTHGMDSLIYKESNDTVYKLDGMARLKNIRSIPFSRPQALALGPVKSRAKIQKLNGGYITISDIKKSYSPFIYLVSDIELMRKTSERYFSFLYRMRRYKQLSMKMRKNSSLMRVDKVISFPDFTNSKSKCPVKNCECSVLGVPTGVALVDHIAIGHYERNENVCPVCNKAFSRPDAVLRHITNARHGPDDNPKYAERHFPPRKRFVFKRNGDYKLFIKDSEITNTFRVGAVYKDPNPDNHYELSTNEAVPEHLRLENLTCI